jgi:hypothetical protein
MQVEQAPQIMVTVVGLAVLMDIMPLLEPVMVQDMLEDLNKVVAEITVVLAAAAQAAPEVAIQDRMLAA